MDFLQETLYPSYCLDLMVLCWSQHPKDRPSASQIVSIASAPEFIHLSDVMSLKHQAAVEATTSAPISHITGNYTYNCVVIIKTNSQTKDGGFYWCHFYCRRGWTVRIRTMANVC